MARSKFPRWVSHDPNTFLREVAPNLFVGAQLAPTTQAWAGIVDLCGSSSSPLMSMHYASCPVFLRWVFDDGDEIPEGLLDAVVPLVAEVRRTGPVLIHCRAGLSRSASVAYAVIRILHELNHRRALDRVFAAPGWPVPNTLVSARAWVFEESGAIGRSRDPEYLEMRDIIQS